jgi:tRNA threonylcarbamoyladenosine biosynthesis protein TsaB
MITLAIDTSDARGGVAVLEDGAASVVKPHEDGSDYSAWLLSAVDAALAQAGTKMKQVELVAVSTGPGSFTGLRVGLTTVKAWAEVYAKNIVGIPRLEAIARSRDVNSTFAATCYDAQRDQLFGGFYHYASSGLERIGDELVVSPADFVAFVDAQVGSQPVTWISLDPGQIQNLETWQRRIAAGDRLLASPHDLVSVIGRLAVERATQGQFSDPLMLDANYVRRSDAEIFWKSGPAGVRSPGDRRESSSDQTLPKRRSSSS